MQHRPVIGTAIPKGRYQIGNFSATLLGEIESRDGRPYRYILAFVPQGERDPKFYVCSEQGGDPARPRYSHLRVVSESLAEVLDSDERWADRDSFVEQALTLGIQALGLSGAQLVKLM